MRKHLKSIENILRTMSFLDSALIRSLLLGEEEKKIVCSTEARLDPLVHFHVLLDGWATGIRV